MLLTSCAAVPSLPGDAAQKPSPPQTPAAATSPAPGSSPSPQQVAPPAVAASEASRDAGSEERPSRLETMISEMNLDKPAVVSRGTCGER